MSNQAIRPGPTSAGCDFGGSARSIVTTKSILVDTVTLCIALLLCAFTRVHRTGRMHHLTPVGISALLDRPISSAALLVGYRRICRRRCSPAPPGEKGVGRTTPCVRGSAGG